MEWVASITWTDWSPCRGLGGHFPWNTQKFERKYDSVKNASFSIDHGIGINTGTVLSVRGGIRGENDLIWIERAPNLAAKLSSLRETPYQTFITARVYNKLNDKSKYGPNWENMWQSRSWNFLGDNLNVYRSSWW